VKRDRSEVIDQRLVRALAHPLRVKILEILTERVTSPNRLSGDLDAGLSHVAYHTRALDKCGCLELVDTAKRRGATEHFYKASPNSFISDRIWRRVPRALLGGVSGATLQSFMDRAVAALEAGTIDSREDTTLYWMPVQLDEEGWDRVTATMEETVNKVLAAEAESKQRLARRKGSGAISAIIGVASFETPHSREELL
jgi:DNA-binding transcriptional ArsR family regulator